MRRCRRIIYRHRRTPSTAAYPQMQMIPQPGNQLQQQQQAGSASSPMGAQAPYAAGPAPPPPVLATAPAPEAVVASTHPVCDTLPQGHSATVATALSHSPGGYTPTTAEYAGPPAPPTPLEQLALQGAASSSTVLATSVSAEPAPFTAAPLMAAPALQPPIGAQLLQPGPAPVLHAEPADGGLTAPILGTEPAPPLPPPE